MIITTPVTDYIPASMLTNDGDMVVRKLGVVERLAKNVQLTFLRSSAGDTYPNWGGITGDIDNYFKGQGGAAWPIFETLALRDTGIHIGNSTRNSAGDQVISGVGFELSVVIFIAMDVASGNRNFSWGFDNGTLAMCIAQSEDDTDSMLMNTHSINIHRDISNTIIGVLSAITANSFTITWSLAGACAVDFIYLCLP